MPYKPKKPCAYPNCPELTHDRFCEKHKPQAAQEYNRYRRDEWTKKFYNSVAWRKIYSMRGGYIDFWTFGKTPDNKRADCVALRRNERKVSKTRE